MAYRLADQDEGDPQQARSGRRARRSRRFASRPPRRRRTVIKSVVVLPTLFTLGNLLCGFFAIFIASRDVATLRLPFNWTPLTLAAVFVFLGMVFDGLDGQVARLTRSTSELGEQLDSMADMVTFGVAPAFMVAQLVHIAAPFFSETGNTDHLFDRIAFVIASIYVACAALRLARFNIEQGSSIDTDHNTFKGLPSPGAAGTVASLVLLHQHFLAHYPTEHLTLSIAAGAMVCIALLVALAMVSQFRYVHMVNRYIRGRVPFGALVTAVIVALLLIVKVQWSLAVIFVCYALSAPLSSAGRWLRPQRLEERG